MNESKVVEVEQSFKELDSEELAQIAGGARDGWPDGSPNGSNM